MSDDFKEIENLVVGGGFSAVSLLRELDHTGNEYLVINAGKPIWHELEKHDRLDFDLVSSLYTSIYSFELVEQMKQNQTLGDRYPTAKEFYEIQKKYHQMYAHKTIKATVTRIDNFEDYSIVHIDNGDKYKAKNVILATAFRRKVHESINNFEFDESLKDKTVVLNTIGDSANLLISKLVFFGAKIKLVCNGFIALEKYFENEALSKSSHATVDQFEYHNLSKIVPTLYEVSSSLGLIQSILLPKKIVDFLYGPLCLATTHPITVRKGLKREIWKIYKNVYLRYIPFFKVSRFPNNGNIAIKFWPIDVYEKCFSDDLEANIEDGFMLNDIIYFIDQGLVELWQKDESIIDKETQTLKSNGKEIGYDYFIEGDRETPNLPDIIYQDKSNDNKNYTYNYRKIFMGVIPSELNNIYFIGYTRPFTGGLNNIAEMQCLFTHKMLTQSDFKDEIHTDLAKKTDAYNKKCYPFAEPKPSDNLVYFGLYTQDIAELMGIQPRLRDCKSLIDVAKLYLFPNNSHYYRQRGEYAIEGASELVDYISDEHYHFLGIIPALITYALMVFAFIATILLLPIPAWVSVPAAVVLISPISLITSLILGNWGIPNNKRPAFLESSHFLILAAGLFSALYFSNWIFSAAAIVASFVLIKICGKKGMNRHLFCDLNFRRSPEHKIFFEKYRKAFLSVFKKRGIKTAQSPKNTSDLASCLESDVS